MSTRERNSAKQLSEWSADVSLYSSILLTDVWTRKQKRYETLSVSVGDWEDDGNDVDNAF